MPPILLRKSLSVQPAPPVWPPAVRFGLFGESEALSVHALIARAYAEAPAGRTFGWIPDFEEWWRGLVTDAEFDPGLCFAVYSGNGRVLAAAQCWTTAFIKDFAVASNARRNGLGTALLNHCFTAFWARGAPVCMLKVEHANDVARSFYAAAGMVEVPDLSGGPIR